MQPEEQKTPIENKQRVRRFNLDLYYYEQSKPDRFYFRLAPLGWLLMILPVAAILALFLFNRLWSDSSRREANINVTIQPTSPSPLNYPVIRQAPPPQMPPSIRKPPVATMPSPPTPPNTNNNANEQLTPGRAVRPDNKRDSK
jgi:hypothetical protein